MVNERDYSLKFAFALIGRLGKRECAESAKNMSSFSLYRIPTVIPFSAQEPEPEIETRRAPVVQRSTVEKVAGASRMVKLAPQQQKVDRYYRTPY